MRYAPFSGKLSLLREVYVTVAIPARGELRIWFVCVIIEIEIVRRQPSLSRRTRLERSLNARKNAGKKRKEKERKYKVKQKRRKVNQRRGKESKLK